MPSGDQAPTGWSPTDPKSFAIPLLSSFPNPTALQIDSKNRVPIPKFERIAAIWNQEAWDLGYRLHPELATKHVIPGDQPGMGPLNPPKIVNKADYDAWVESTSGQATEDLEGLLRKIDPAEADRIASLTDAQKKAELTPEAGRKAAEALALLQKLAEAQQQAETAEPDESAAE